jgi:hypothetical protein
MRNVFTQLCLPCVFVSVLMLVSCGRQSSQSEAGAQTTRHPDSEAPELAPFFPGDRYYYLGEFYQNYVYLMKHDSGRFLDTASDGQSGADVHTAREAAFIIVYDVKSDKYATVDLQNSSFEKMSLKDLKFTAASQDSLAAKALARASAPDSYKQDQKQGKRALWVYVDTHVNQSAETYYAETTIHTEPKTGYKFFELISVTHERLQITVDGKARKFRAQALDLLGTPIGDSNEREMKEGDIASAISRLSDTRAIE